jgi:hypothetical protein
MRRRFSGASQLAIVLDLALLRGVERQVPDLRETVDDLRDLLPELALDVGDGDRGVLDHVVNQTACHGHGVELQVGENARDLHAMRNERLAGEARLAGVRPLTVLVGALEELVVEPFANPRGWGRPPRNVNGRRCGRRHTAPSVTSDP